MSYLIPKSRIHRGFYNSILTTTKTISNITKAELKDTKKIVYFANYLLQSSDDLAMGNIIDINIMMQFLRFIRDEYMKLFISYDGTSIHWTLIQKQNLSDRDINAIEHEAIILFDRLKYQPDSTQLRNRALLYLMVLYIINYDVSKPIITHKDLGIYDKHQDVDACDDYQSKPAEVVLMRHFKLYDIKSIYIDKLSNKSRYKCFQIECDFDKLYTFLQMDRWDTPILRFAENLRLTGFREGSYYTLMNLEQIDGELLGQINIPYKTTHLIEDLPYQDHDIPQGEFKVKIDRSILYKFHEYEFVWFNSGVKKPYIIHGRFEESDEGKFWVDCVTDSSGKVLINSKKIHPHEQPLHGVLYGLISSEII